MISVAREHVRDSIHDSIQFLRWGGLAAWLMVGLPVMTHPHESPAVLLVWTFAWFLFAAAFWTTSGEREIPRWADLGLLGLQAACVMALVLTLCDGFEGALLVLVAMQLASRVDRRTGLLWIAVQTVLLCAAITIHWSLRPALMLAPPYLGFQILAFLAFEALDREARGRQELARINAELRSTRELLAHGSRMAERLRIAGELHDALGHHLVALSLNLEVAAQQSQGEAREQVRISQSLARLMLTDVSEIVDTLRKEEAFDLRRALTSMAAEIPRPRVHLVFPDGPDDFAVEDAELAHLLLRCCQEIATNAAKHAQAENLWLELVREGDSVGVRARDDGRGSERVEDGRGLTGMRQRLEQAGGRLEIATGPGLGFAVAALVPLRRSV
ncbi:MAG TPA: histidine kinase [Thermoanaerobaculia bacterium]|nr:histidine kinase [Thermoanaerobaculia bacterium]